MRPKNTSTPIRPQSLVQTTLFIELNPGDKQRHKMKNSTRLGVVRKAKLEKRWIRKHVGSWGDKSIPKWIFSVWERVLNDLRFNEIMTIISSAICLSPYISMKWPVCHIKYETKKIKSAVSKSAFFENHAKANRNVRPQGFKETVES